MTTHTPALSPQRVNYAITIQGALDANWADYFDQMRLMAQDDGTTVIHAFCVDQAALHALLARVRDLGLTLLRVEQVPS